MSEWAYFSGTISLKPKINLSYVLEHSPKGSEGGLIFKNTKFKNVYTIDHSLRDVEFNESTRAYIEYWLNAISPYIYNFLCTITFKSHKNFLIYYVGIDKQIIKHIH